MNKKSYYHPEEVSITDTTGTLTEEDVQRLREILSEDMNEIFNARQDC